MPYDGDMTMGMGMSGMLHPVSAEGYEFILKDREIYPGSILGLEKIFIDKNNASLDTVVVSLTVLVCANWSDCVLIYLFRVYLCRV